MSKEQDERTILLGCEVGCLTGDLLTCPLSEAERESCPRRRRWELRWKISVVVARYAREKGILFYISADELVDKVLPVIGEDCVMVDKGIELPMTGIEADMWQKGWRPTKPVIEKEAQSEPKGDKNGILT